MKTQNNNNNSHSKSNTKQFFLKKAQNERMNNIHYKKEYTQQGAVHWTHPLVLTLKNFSKQRYNVEQMQHHESVTDSKASAGVYTLCDPVSIFQSDCMNSTGRK